WKFKRAWRVEAGSDHTEKIAPYGEVRALLESEPGQSIIALADYTPDFDSSAAGIAYFVVFSTAPMVNTKESRVTLTAALVERTSLDAPQEIDPKTKRPIPVAHNWRMTFPSKYDFSFASITTKRLVASIRMERAPRQERALVVEGTRGAFAPLLARPELLEDYFRLPFSIAFWFRTNAADETLMKLHSEDGNDLRLAIGLLGEPILTRQSKQVSSAIVSTHAFCNDGEWHYLVLSSDSLGMLRLFVDAEPPTSQHLSTPLFHSISTMMLGDSFTSYKDFSIDELHLERGAYREPSEFERGMMITAPDTGHNAFGIFHFDGYAGWARSSVAETAPLYFTLDSFAVIRTTTSPVMLAPVLLSAELPSPTRVHLHWSRTSELGVKQYRLELRIGAYGAFEKFLTVDAKHGIKSPIHGQPIISGERYDALEELPALKGDLDLYFRVAVVGFNKKEEPSYSMSVKVEYGSDRDVFVEQNDPEPFATATQVAFRLMKPELVRLSVFDMI
ncbi:MAG: LamG-like jellyroll fold domain-containing protein, partial [Candidatus Kapaibacterium sp.]